MDHGFNMRGQILVGANQAFCLEEFKSQIKSRRIIKLMALMFKKSRSISISFSLF